VFAHLARALGPESYGHLEFAMAVTLALGLVAEGGLGLYGAREIAKDRGLAGRLTVHIVLLRVLLASIAFLLLVAFANASGIAGPQRQLLFLYGLTLFAGAGLLNWAFQGLEEMHWIALGSIVRWGLFAAMVFVVGATQTSAVFVPIAELSAILCVVVLGVIVFSRRVGPIPAKVDASFAMSLLRQTFPIALTQIMWGLKVYMPTIMLGLMIGGAAVGWFGAAHRIVIALHTFVWMYFFNLYPSLSRCAQQPPEALRDLLRRSLRLTVAAALLIGGAGSVLAAPLCAFVYGPEYSEAVTAFQILIWFVAMSLVSSHYMYLLIAYGRQWLELASAVVGALMNIAIGYVLIPKLGFVGAAWSLLIAESSVWTLNYTFARRYVAVLPTWRYLAGPAMASNRS
jgi:O-antigen/teichoic acid export membrane protein